MFEITQKMMVILHGFQLKFRVNRIAPPPPFMDAECLKMQEKLSLFCFYLVCSQILQCENRRPLIHGRWIFEIAQKMMVILLGFPMKFRINRIAPPLHLWTLNVWNYPKNDGDFIKQLFKCGELLDFFLIKAMNKRATVLAL